MENKTNKECDLCGSLIRASWKGATCQACMQAIARARKEGAAQAEKVYRDLVGIVGGETEAERREACVRAVEAVIRAGKREFMRALSTMRA